MTQREEDLITHYSEEGIYFTGSRVIGYSDSPVIGYCDNYPSKINRFKSKKANIAKAGRLIDSKFRQQSKFVDCYACKCKILYTEMGNHMKTTKHIKNVEIDLASFNST